MTKITQLLKDIWPNEEDILVRPDRLKYVRRIVKSDSCVFCEAGESRQRKEKLVLYKSDRAMALMNKYPYNNGHLLIMPRDHIAHIEDLKQDVFLEVHELLRAAIKILKTTYKCPGLNVGLNLGAVAGAGIPDHLHYHVIPRWGGDTNFFPLIAKTKLVVETHETTYRRLYPHFKKLEKAKI